MPRKATGLTVVRVKSAKPGRYGDGGGLYLLVRPQGARFWLFRYRSPEHDPNIKGKLREMGLGPAAGTGAVTLAKAREKAAALLTLVRAKTDPLAQREAEAKTAAEKARSAKVRGKTFRDVAEEYVKKNEIGWTNAHHAYQWSRTLEMYIYPHMGALPVAEVAAKHVITALTPIWSTKPETAARVCGRIEAVLNYATAMGWRKGDNPARWRGHVANMLPARAKVRAVKHHAAMPYTDLAAFMPALKEENGIAALAVQFIVLTAARTAEAFGARWGEVDLQAAVWTVPPERMKARKEHHVPLSDAALAILRELAKLRPTGDAGSAFIFPGARHGRPLSGMAGLMLLRRMKHGDLTVHGFRSTFRDWCGDVSTAPREVAEFALAHTVHGKTEGSYARSTLFEKRRKLMDEWAAFCALPPAGANVVQIRQPASHAVH